LKIGDSFSNYGEDPEKPWGYMRHIFWPRAHVTGTVIANGHAFDAKGLGMYVHAVQGMKPHHAACKWNFGNFQGKNISAIMMEFTTPPSYGSQTVNIGGIVKEDGTLVAAAVENAAIHKSTKKDEENGWEHPTSIELQWMGVTKEGVEVTATTESGLENLVERVDVLAEIPAVIKAFIAGIAGTKPFIYQVQLPRSVFNHSIVILLHLNIWPETKLVKRRAYYTLKQYLSHRQSIISDCIADFVWVGRSVAFYNNV